MELLARQWWHTPLIPALGRQRHKQADLCEFKASLELVLGQMPKLQRKLVSEKKNGVATEI